jgi:hypothetical protein
LSGLRTPLGRSPLPVRSVLPCCPFFQDRLCLPNSISRRRGHGATNTDTQAHPALQSLVFDPGGRTPHTPGLVPGACPVRTPMLPIFSGQAVPPKFNLKTARPWSDQRGLPRLSVQSGTRFRFRPPRYEPREGRRSSCHRWSTGGIVPPRNGRSPGGATPFARICRPLAGLKTREKIASTGCHRWQEDYHPFGVKRDKHWPIVPQMQTVSSTLGRATAFFESPSRVAAAAVLGRRLRINSAPRPSSPKIRRAGFAPSRSTCYPCVRTPVTLASGLYTQRARRPFIVPKCDGDRRERFNRNELKPRADRENRR